LTIKAELQELKHEKAKDNSKRGKEGKVLRSTKLI